MSDPHLPARKLASKVRLARWVLLVEHAWPRFFPAVALLGLFVACSLFGLFGLVGLLPPVLHLVLLVAVGALLVVLVLRGGRGLALPSREEALARLERDNRLDHRPLRALEDELPPTVTDPLTLRLWQRHRARLAAALARLRLGPPHSAMPRHDPFAFRFLLLLLLVLGFVDAREDAGRRILAAMMPGTAAAVGAMPVSTALWITPPTYTGRPPLGPAQIEGQQRLLVPQGSEVLLQVQGLDPDAPPPVLFAESALSPTSLGATGAETRFIVDQAGKLVVGDAEEPIMAIDLDIVPDEVPMIEFVRPPAPAARGALEIAFDAMDDYGLVEIAFVVAPPDRMDEPERLILATPANAPADLNSSSFLDLTAHPFAGIEVDVHLEAGDGLGQTGVSVPVRIRLPERAFSHPLARAVIAERKRLVALPHRRREVARNLDALAAGPVAESFGARIQLALGAAASRLDLGIMPQARQDVIDLLWEIALYIEDGELALAERTLRELQDMLQRALLEGAEDAELEKLMDALEQALDRFVAELARRGTEQGQDAPRAMTPPEGAQTVTREDLMAMLERAREMMQGGARDAARAMLNELQQTLENLQAGMAPQQPHPGEEMLGDLQRMIELQQDLLERSFDMQRQRGEGQASPGQDGEQGQQGGQGAGQASSEQEGLRRALGELMRRMGEAGLDIPRALGGAEMEMRQARDALDQAAPGQAVRAQSEALDLMQQGGQAMLEQMREQMARQPGTAPQPNQAGNEGRDPLGRSMRREGGFDGEGVAVPDGGDLGRARDILEELYRRSGQRSRPPEELDYFNRLLDRF